MAKRQQARHAHASPEMKYLIRHTELKPRPNTVIFPREQLRRFLRRFLSFLFAIVFCKYFEHVRLVNAFLVVTHQRI